MKINIRHALAAMAIALPVLAHAGFIAEDGALERVAPPARAAEPEAAKVAVPAEPARAAKPAKAAEKAPQADDAKAKAPDVQGQLWVARSGSTLRKTVEEWCRVIGWTPVWEPVDLDYPNPATRTFEGGFEQAVKELFAPYEKAKRPLLADGWRGNAVLFISEKR